MAHGHSKCIHLGYYRNNCKVQFRIYNSSYKTINHNFFFCTAHYKFTSELNHIIITSTDISITRCSSLNDIIIAIISARRYLTICYILCCRNSILCSHIGYISCGCNLCSSAISIVCVHFKVFKCSLVRSRCVQLC